MAKASRITTKRKQILLGLLVVTVASLIFAFRNYPAFTIANFYAEDATVLFNDLFTMNPVRAIFEPFNGYLITGLYLLAAGARGLNIFFGGDLVTLPVATAVVSTVFLGLAASLPYLLFKKELGTRLSLVLVFFTAFIPIRSFDYAVIGTLGNLKFVFLYIAFMLVLYRQKRLPTYKYLIVDAILLICVTTNAAVPFLVPLILWPQGYELCKKILGRANEFKLTIPFMSAFLVVFLSAAYVVIAYLKGIPELPGYLDTPFKKAALLPILDRSTYYAWLYPVTSGFNSYFVGGLLAATAVGLLVVLKRDKSSRFAIVAALWAIFLGTGLFVVSRPGVSEYYLTYSHFGGPDQFFFAQTMIFLFATGWLLRKKLARLKPKQVKLLAAGLVLYVLLAIPQSTSFGKSSTVYDHVQPLDTTLSKICRQPTSQTKATIPLYPSPVFQWRVDRNQACD